MKPFTLEQQHLQDTAMSRVTKKGTLQMKALHDNMQALSLTDEGLKVLVEEEDYKSE